MKKNYVYLFFHQTSNTLSVYAGGTLSNNTYRWYKDGSLTATISSDSTFIPTTGGAYYVEVTNAIATKLTLYSDTLTVGALTALQQNDIVLKASNRINLSVYPNPAKPTTTIAFTATGKCIIKLTNISGKILQAKTIVAVKGSNTLQLDISEYAAGIYLVTIVNEKKESQAIKLKKE